MQHPDAHRVSGVARSTCHLVGRVGPLDPPSNDVQLGVDSPRKRIVLGELDDLRLLASLDLDGRGHEPASTGPGINRHWTLAWSRQRFESR